MDYKPQTSICSSSSIKKAFELNSLAWQNSPMTMTDAKCYLEILLTQKYSLITRDFVNFVYFVGGVDHPHHRTQDY
jgi:hypothetical protein